MYPDELHDEVEKAIRTIIQRMARDWMEFLHNLSSHCMGSGWKNLGTMQIILRKVWPKNSLKSILIRIEKYRMLLFKSFTINFEKTIG